MNSHKNNIILIILLTSFFLLFRFSTLIHESVIDSLNLFFTSLVPSMLPMFILIDLTLNYGLANHLYKIFKTNSIILVILSLLAGTPSNAKYIREFYKEGYITRDLGNLLLMFSYSPNPLFILTFSSSFQEFLHIILYLYITNVIIFITFKHKFKNIRNTGRQFESRPFIECLTNSIYKSAKILVLILGIVVTFGIANTMLNIFHFDTPLSASMIELTNAFHIITKLNLPTCYLMFAASFGGISIHAQIKSILEDTDLSYRYFMLGRLLASIPVFIFILFDQIL